VLSVTGGHSADMIHAGSRPSGWLTAMTEDHTIAAVQRYLDELGHDAPPEPVIRALLDKAAGRQQLLCTHLLYRSYPRLRRAPLNLQAEELLGGVVERLLKALRRIRPQTVRQFFALANQHIRWELNDLARRLDQAPCTAELKDAEACVPESSASLLSPAGRRMLEAIENLPEAEQEVFGLVRIQGLTPTESATILGVSTKTVQRRLNRGLVLLAEQLKDLSPLLQQGEAPIHWKA
jgi:RNA polymerase sigma factor (sigma-70 family)